MATLQMTKRENEEIKSSSKNGSTPQRVAVIFLFIVNTNDNIKLDTKG